MAEYRKCRRCRVVAEQFGCSNETVRRALIKYGEPRIIRHPREETKPRASEAELRLIVEEYYISDANINDLAKKHHRSQITISNAIKQYGNGLKQCPANNKKITDEQILEAVGTMTRREIADKYGVHVENLAKRMKKLGVTAVHANHVNSGSWSQVFGECWHYVGSHKIWVEERQPGFEYTETKSAPTRRIRLKCRTCGHIVDRHLSTVQRNNVCCENCSARENEEKELSKSRNELIRVFCAIKEKKTPKRCKTCGDVFYSGTPNKIYCSDKCRRKGKRKTGGYRQRCRHYGVYYDSSVTREKVVKRDNNICQICGKTCNPRDKRWGHSGPDFPTLDHIIPLAKGGTHTWDNSQCACGMCNSYKRDLIDEVI